MPTADPSSKDVSPIQVLNDLVADISVAMLTTIDRHGRLSSRPMTTQQRPFDGFLWFLTDRRTHTVEDLTLHPQVNVSFTHSEDQRYVSCSGEASLVEDRALVREFWQAPFAVWFPQGPDDSDLVLLRVRVDAADYWDTPSSWPGRLLAFAKTMATGDKSAHGARGHVDLSNGALPQPGGPS